jgi:hypothetical protein
LTDTRRRFETDDRRRVVELPSWATHPAAALDLTLIDQTQKALR